MEGAEAKASFGLAVNYKALEALVEALVSKETLTGKEVQDILEANDVVRYPDPFVDGFGWDNEGSLFFPGSPKVRFFPLKPKLNIRTENTRAHRTVLSFLTAGAAHTCSVSSLSLLSCGGYLWRFRYRLN